jgi:REP element-mobilizing transposase RayT
MITNTHVISSSMKNYFGGEHLKFKRKSQRPLDFKKTTHLVLRLKPLLPALMNPRDKNLRKGFCKIADKYNIKIYQLVFNHSHLHAAILIPDRHAYVSFIRELTSKLVAYFSRTTKVQFKKIFLNRPFTRIVQWGKGFGKLMNYFVKNEKESGVQQVQFNSKEKIRSKESGQLLLFELSI